VTLAHLYNDDLGWLAWLYRVADTVINAIGLSSCTVNDALPHFNHTGQGAQAAYWSAGCTASILSTSSTDSCGLQQRLRKDECARINMKKASTIRALYGVRFAAR
jgi:hypothetical protein